MYILAEDLVVEDVEVVGPDLGLGPRDADHEVEVGQRVYQLELAPLDQRRH